MFALLALAACAPPATIPPAPSAVADATRLDEDILLGVEKTYRATRKALELAVDLGVLTGQRAATAAKADRAAYDAVKVARLAYAAGNAPDYLTASAKASAAVGQLLQIVKG